MGKKLVKRLVASGNHTVYATSLKKMQLYGVQMFTSNLQNADINSLVEKLTPNAIVHCAALASPDACEVDRFMCRKMNVEVTSRIAAACKDYGVYLAFLSTDLVFDGQRGGYSEEGAVNPISYYGESKVECENLLKATGIPHSVVRTSLVFGYEDKLSRPNILTRVVQQLGKQRSYSVPTDQVRTPTLAEDLARGIEAIVDARKEGIYHIAGDSSITVADFASQVSRVFGLDETLLQRETSQRIPAPAPRPLNSSLAIGKARRELGYSPTPIVEAIGMVKSQMTP